MNRTAFALRALAIALSVAGGAGCRHEQRELERAEAARVSRAVDLLRKAANSQKAPLLQALRHTSCTFERVCSLKRDCASAYELQIAALDAVSAARAGLAGDGGRDSDVAALVARAEQNLARSYELLQRCLAEQGTLRVEFGL